MNQRTLATDETPNKPSAGFACNPNYGATQHYELCPRMAWQYHGYEIQDTQHENWFLSVVLPRHLWACLLLSLLKRIEDRTRLVASSTNQDASTRSQRSSASAPKKSSRDAKKKTVSSTKTEGPRMGTD